jgi:D-threo-aldose 1-dehydrogenase
MEIAHQSNFLGQTELAVPPIVFGSSSFGNLYEVVPYESKLETAREWFAQMSGQVVIDSAGKYGAGLALESLGNVLRDLQIDPERVVISNKLGWKRVPMKNGQITFEKDVWFGLEYDAESHISYQGILDCYEQGLKLLGQPYGTQLVSVHDPDEYLMAADGAEDYESRFQNIVEAYRALDELKKEGEVAAIGIGSKDWTFIEKVSEHVKLDWIMLACSLTPYTHDEKLLRFIEKCHATNISIINSAVFNGGFLMGGDYFDYRRLDPVEDEVIYQWRSRFHETCDEYDVKPYEACVQFGMQLDGVVATALNTTKPHRIAGNIAAVAAKIPSEFWLNCQNQELIAPYYPIHTQV